MEVAEVMSSPITRSDWPTAGRWIGVPQNGPSTIKAFVPDFGSNGIIAVFWSGMLGSAAISEWLNFVSAKIVSDATFVVDTWDDNANEPASVTKERLMPLLESLTTKIDSTLSVTVSDDSSSEPKYYLWGSTGPTEAHHASKGYEVGLRLAQEEMATPDGKAFVGRLIAGTTNKKLTSALIDRMLIELVDTMGA